MIRLFVAVDIDSDTRAQLTRVRHAIQRVIDREPRPPRVTWVKDEAAHVTIRFIGATPDEQVRVIQEALATVRFTPFTVEWGTLGVFGGMRHPRVIWMAPISGAEQLRDVAQRVNAALDPILGAGESRPFAPHLTVGRVREPGRGVDWRQALEGTQLDPTLSRVDHVTLYESRLSPKGPTYTALSTHG